MTDQIYSDQQIAQAQESKKWVQLSSGEVGYIRGTYASGGKVMFYDFEKGYDYEVPRNQIALITDTEPANLPPRPVQQNVLEENATVPEENKPIQLTQEQSNLILSQKTGFPFGYQQNMFGETVKADVVENREFESANPEIRPLTAMESSTIMSLPQGSSGLDKVELAAPDVSLVPGVGFDVSPMQSGLGMAEASTIKGVDLGESSAIYALSRENVKQSFPEFAQPAVSFATGAVSFITLPFLAKDIALGKTNIGDIPGGIYSSAVSDPTSFFFENTGAVVGGRVAFSAFRNPSVIFDTGKATAKINYPIGEISTRIGKIDIESADPFLKGKAISISQAGNKRIVQNIQFSGDTLPDNFYLGNRLVSMGDNAKAFRIAGTVETQGSSKLYAFGAVGTVEAESETFSNIRAAVKGFSAKKADVGISEGANLAIVTDELNPLALKQTYSGAVIARAEKVLSTTSGNRNSDLYLMNSATIGQKVGGKRFDISAGRDFMTIKSPENLESTFDISGSKMNFRSKSSNPRVSSVLEGVKPIAKQAAFPKLRSQTSEIFNLEKAGFVARPLKTSFASKILSPTANFVSKTRPITFSAVNIIGKQATSTYNSQRYIRPLKLSQIGRSSSILSQRLFTLPGQSQSNVPRSRISTSYQLRTRQIQNQQFSQRFANPQNLATRQKFDFIPSFAPPPSIVPNMPTPIFGFGGGGFSRKSSAGKISSKRAYKYAPQIAAIGLNIKSFKMPSTLSGLEIRPIISGSARKKKRRKR